MPQINHWAIQTYLQIFHIHGLITLHMVLSLLRVLSSRKREQESQHIDYPTRWYGVFYLHFHQTLSKFYLSTFTLLTLIFICRLESASSPSALKSISKKTEFREDTENLHICMPDKQKNTCSFISDTAYWALYSRTPWLLWNCLSCERKRWTKYVFAFLSCPLLILAPF